MPQHISVSYAISGVTTGIRLRYLKMFILLNQNTSNFIDLPISSYTKKAYTASVLANSVSNKFA